MDRFGRENNFWLGKKLSPEHCENIRLARIGKKFSETSKLKMRLSHLGHKHLEETKLKMSIIHKGKCPNKGYKWTEEQKENLSNIKKGKINIGSFKKGQISWMKGKENIWSKTPEYRQKMREATLGKKNGFYGKTHTPEVREKLRQAHWQGGISFEPYPLGWTKTHREQIRQRDEYKCQLCGVPEVECLRKLHVHHKDYIKENILPDNLISLCNKCHAKTNHNREYWIKYFSEVKQNV